jgi:hypothetical protein
MVQEGDFLFELVDVETKLPFKEHVKDDQVYVEVEPDAEYFIKLRKFGSTGFGTSSGTIVCEFHVDGKSLGYQRTFRDRDTSTNEDFDGIFERRNGCHQFTALKFMKAEQKWEHPETIITGRPPFIMGKVEVFIYEGIFDKIVHKQSDFASPFTPVSLAIRGQVYYGAKFMNIRSKRGAVSHSRTFTDSFANYSKGRLLDIISLNYCAAYSLITLEVLPRPDSYISQYLVNNYLEGKNGEKIQPLKIQPKIIRHSTYFGDVTVELFDLVDDE